MRQRIIFFLVVLSLMFSGKILGQQKIAGLRYPVDYKSILCTQFGAARFDESCQINSYKGVDISGLNAALITLRPQAFLSKPVIGPSYYCNSLGFFCQKELQIQKFTSLPIFFRLGSLEYVNYMEQKPNAVKPQ